MKNQPFQIVIEDSRITLALRRIGYFKEYTQAFFDHRFYAMHCWQPASDRNQAGA